MWEKADAGERLISNNGNFLFYNSPVSIDKKNGGGYVAFVTNDGKVIVQFSERGSAVKEFVVHDYKSNIRKTSQGSNADDHAAPAIIYDKKKDRILLATSYHGTPLYVYEVLGDNGTRLLAKLDGRYTYPRWFSFKQEVYLLTRKQPEGIKSGDLVLLKSKDLFASEEVLLRAEDGFVVYASSPAVYSKGIFLHYSMHSYEEKRLIGWDLLQYDLTADTVNTCKLDHLLSPGYASNRPTGINFSNGKVVLGTASFNRMEYSKSPGFFNRENEVLIAKIDEVDLCSSAKIIHKANAIAPYYHTAISVSNDLSWLYFDKYSYVTNKVRPFWLAQCFKGNIMMYPNFSEKSVYFASVNKGNYKIRDFDNSIRECYFDG